MRRQTKNNGSYRQQNGNTVMIVVIKLVKRSYKMAMWQMYLLILPIGLGIMTLVASLMCLFAYLTSNEKATRLPAFKWFKRLLVVAFLLLSIGIYMTVKHFWIH